MRFYVVLLSLLSALQGLAQTANVRVLVFSRTAGFRHASIPDGIAAIRRLADERGFFVEASEDPTVFRDGQLEQYRAVVFLSTTGDILTRPQEEAFERYIRRGGGFVGIHAAADTRCRPLDEYSGCQGCFTTLGGHGSQADDLFYTVEARYTDAGGPGVGSLTARTGLILQPKRKEAEHYTRQNGVLLEDTGDVRGGVRR